MVLLPLAPTFLLFSAALGQLDPGLPLSNPTISYWQIPPNKDVADHQSSKLPDVADVVIIGSGMTGTSVARHLLKQATPGADLKIAMLEARQACSGATGRNGGEISTLSPGTYAQAKLRFSKEEAEKRTRFETSHVSALTEAANELSPEGRDAAEVRSTELIFALWTADSVSQFNGFVETLKKEVPDLGNEWLLLDRQQTRNLTLITAAVGALVGSPKVAGALWPYRFVTHQLKELLDAHPGFSLDTHTPVLNISTVQNDSQPVGPRPAVFRVTTERGTILARHVVHAENAWIPHLVPGLQTKLTGMRLHMSAQLGGAGLPKPQEWPKIFSSNVSRGRTWLLRGDDYIIHQPRNGEFMFGGDNIVNVTPPVPWYDDSAPPNHDSVAYLNGALPDYFGYDNWGPERTDFPQPADPAVWKGRTKRVWTGIETNSPDRSPLVGRLPETVTTRRLAVNASGAEWISTGYDGNGMCFAFLCGKALSSAILGFESRSGQGNRTDTYPDWFPQSYLITEGRLANATSPSVSSPSRRRL